MAIDSEQQYHIPKFEPKADEDTVPVETVDAVEPATDVETDSPPEAEDLSINDELGLVNEEITRLGRRKAEIAGKFAEMQGTRGAEYTAEIEAATYALAEAEARREKLLQRVDNSGRTGLLGRIGRVVFRR